MIGFVVHMKFITYATLYVHNIHNSFYMIIYIFFNLYRNIYDLKNALVEQYFFHREGHKHML